MIDDVLSEMREAADLFAGSRLGDDLARWCEALRSEPIAWVSNEGLHNIRRARRRGLSHYTVHVRVDRTDDYHPVPLYARSATASVTQSQPPEREVLFAALLAMNAVVSSPVCHPHNAVMLRDAIAEARAVLNEVAAGSATPIEEDTDG